MMQRVNGSAVFLAELIGSARDLLIFVVYLGDEIATSAGTSLYAEALKSFDKNCVILTLEISCYLVSLDRPYETEARVAKVLIYSSAARLAPR